MGFYLLFPIVISNVGKMAAPVREGVLSTVSTYNRYAQIGLVIQLLTGIYLVFEGDYSVLWTIVVTVLFLLAGGFSGMLGKPLRRAKAGDTASLAVIQTYSILLAVTMIALIFFMVYRKLI